jgi:hypothetical protein
MSAMGYNPAGLSDSKDHGSIKLTQIPKRLRLAKALGVYAFKNPSR